MGNLEKERPVSPRNGVPLPRGKPFEPGEEQRERSRKAGKRSVEARRARKTLRNELLDLLTVMIEKDGVEKSAQEAISSALVKRAIDGDTKAFEIIRDTIGEKPTENVNIFAADFAALDDAFSRMGDAE